MKKGWEIKKLGEVCEVIAGQSPEGKYYNTLENGLPFYQGKKEFEEKYLGTPTTWTTKVTKEAKAGDILMSVRAPVGPVNFSTQKICIGRGLASIRAGNQIDKEFLFNFLIKHENEIVGNTGAVFNSINKTQIENIEIPLPSLAEQQRIVTILDEAFAAIDKAKENAEKNLQNAREIFESFLQSVFANKGKRWEEKKLGEVCETGAGGTPLKSHKEYYKDGNIPWLLSGEVSQGEIFEATNFITKKGLENSSAKLFPKNSVLVAMYGATAGQIGILRFEAATNQAVCAILPNKKFIPNYVYYCFLSKKNELISQAIGNAQPNISQLKIRNTFIPIPSLNEQKIVVNKLDSLSTETKKLETIYQKKIEDLGELKKSVLQKAFNGELKISQVTEKV